MSNDTTLTIVGNLVADPELGFTAFSRGFVISEVVAGWNRRVAVQW